MRFLVPGAKLKLGAPNIDIVIIIMNICVEDISQ